MLLVDSSGEGKATIVLMNIVNVETFHLLPPFLDKVKAKGIFGRMVGAAGCT